MIILERLAITRFKGVRGVAFELPERGAILIEGNNEAGKSTLFEAIHFAMYGRTLAGSLGDAIPHDANDVEVALRVRIDRPGEPPDILDITRTITQGNGQVTSGVRLRVERGGTAAEEIRRIGDANRRIALELGGLTAETFVNSCFVPQKQLAGLETLDRGQREAAVASLLNLDRLTRAAQSFAIRSSDTEDLRLHDARVALADGTERLSAIEERRVAAEVGVRRLDVLDALDTLAEASRRAQEASARARTAVARRAHASLLVRAHDTAVDAGAAWIAVERAIRNAVDARDASRRSRSREADAASAHDAIPDAEARRDRLRGIDTRVASVTRWLVEGRPALRQQVSAIDTRRAARIRAAADLQRAEDDLRALDDEARAHEARRAELGPPIAARETALAHRVAIYALRDAVITREARVRAAADADLAVAARVDADDQLASVRERLAEATAGLAVLERDRDAVAHRDRLTTVRATLASAIAARDAHVQARARNDRLRDLTLGVLDAGTNTPERLALRLLVDHPIVGSRVVELGLDSDGVATVSSRGASDEEVARAKHGEVPTLAPADLNALDRDANLARDALAPLGELPPPTARAARDRLAELDAILASPAPSFDAAAYAAAVAARERADAESRVHQAAVDAMDSPTVLARRASAANTEAETAIASVTRAAMALGIDATHDAEATLRLIDAARHAADLALEATAAASGALESLERESAAFAARRIPASARAIAAREDLARDDDAALELAEAEVRTAGRAGDGDAIAEWQLAVTEASAFGLAAPIIIEGALPTRDVVAAFAELIGNVIRDSGDEIARLRARANDLRSATADVALEAEREQRAMIALEDVVRAAHDATARAIGLAATEVGHPFEAAVQTGATAAKDFGQAHMPDASGHLPPAGSATEIADAFTAASQTLDVHEARRSVDDATDGERDADRAYAAARADGDSAWRTASEAGSSCGVEIGERLDDLGEEGLAGIRARVTATHGFEPDRERAEATLRAVHAEFGAATEAIAAARRTIGAEDAMPLAEARRRREAARLDLRARERAGTILTTTRARMMAAILPDTQREMSRLLPDLTAGRYRFPRLDDRFQLEVYDERKRGWIRRSLFSGGTQDQFSLALRLGFAIAALPRELGTAPGFLFLDEPLSSFDRDRTRALVDLLRDPMGIVGTHFRQVFLISHSQAFDPGLFAFQIEMEAGRVARTTLPGGAAAAPVVALPA